MSSLLVWTNQTKAEMFAAYGEVAMKKYGKNLRGVAVIQDEIKYRKELELTIAL